MPQNAKTRFTAFTEATIHAASESASALSKNTRAESLEKSKKQAEEPLYLNRM
jgi:hypothetical protein